MQALYKFHEGDFYTHYSCDGVINALALKEIDLLLPLLKEEPQFLLSIKGYRQQENFDVFMEALKDHPEILWEAAKRSRHESQNLMKRLQERGISRSRILFCY